MPKNIQNYWQTPNQDPGTKENAKTRYIVKQKEKYLCISLPTCRKPKKTINERQKKQNFTYRRIRTGITVNFSLKTIQARNEVKSLKC